MFKSNLRDLLCVMIFVGIGFRGAAAAEGDPATQPTTQTAATAGHILGRLVEIDDNILKIRNRSTKAPAISEVIATDQNTQVIIDGGAGTVADLKPGMLIDVMPLRASRRLPVRFAISATSESTGGTVTKVDGNTITIHVGPTTAGRDVTLTSDDATRISFLGEKVDGQAIKAHKANIDDLKAGMRVMVIPDTGTAKVIYIHPTTAPAANP